MTITEFLTNQYYLWDYRTRGILLFDQPIQLEPPFIPFVRTIPQLDKTDDSHRPTMVSSMVKWIFKKEKKFIAAPEFEMEYDEVTPFVYSFDGSLRVLSIDVSHVGGMAYQSESLYNFLSHLSLYSETVSFEIYSKNAGLYVQFVVESEAYPRIKILLQSHFPEIHVSENSSGLELFHIGKQTYLSEFGLAEESARPIRLQETTKFESLLPLFAILETLKKDEVAGLQVLITNTINPWGNELRRSISLPTGGSFFENEPNAPKILEQKLSSPLLCIAVRTFSQATTSEIQETLNRTIAKISDCPTNRLLTLTADSTRFDTLMEDVYLRQSHRLGMLMCASEVATFVHIPKIPNLSGFAQSRKHLPVLDRFRNHDCILGENFYENNTTIISCSIEDRLKHMHILGSTGSGKSSFLAHLIIQDIKLGYGVGVFDPHGDLIELCLEHIPKEKHDKIVLFDLADSESVIPLNLLDSFQDFEKELLVTDLVASFRRHSTSWGDQMNSVLSNALLALVENRTKSTLWDLKRFLVDEDFRESKLKSCMDETVIYYWKKEFTLLKTNSIGPILTRLDSFLRPKILRKMFSQDTGIDFKNLFDEGKILFVKLPLGIIGKENAFLLGSMLLSRLHLAALGRQNKASRLPFFLYLDEFHNFITPSITDMLSGVRKYGLGLILTHQDLSQLSRDSELHEGIMANANIRVVFRVGESDSKKLAGELGNMEILELQNLGKGEAIVKIEQPRFTTTLNASYLTFLEYHDVKENIASIKEALKQNYSKYQVKEELDLWTGTLLPETTLDEIGVDVPLVESNSIPDKITVAQTIDVFPSPATEKSINSQEVRTHKYLQELIKRYAESQGYIAEIEAPLQHSNGHLDVLLKNGNDRIAIEISVTTDSQWETHNIEKCLPENLSSIYLVSGDPKILKTLESNFSAEVITKHNLNFVTPDRLFEALKTEKRSDNESKNIVKGYRVSVSYGDSKEKNVKKTISEVVQKAMKRKKT